MASVTVEDDGKIFVASYRIDPANDDGPSWVHIDAGELGKKSARIGLSTPNSMARQLLVELIAKAAP